ncbi:MAG: DUF3025 domain-containing protein [Lautropia sp.]|nr:DUF3025 domain-containing protein [Lautropia sp.]
MSLPPDPFLHRLFSPRWTHPGFAPYRPILRRLRRLALMRAGLGEGAAGFPCGTFDEAASGSQVVDQALADDPSGWDVAHWLDLFNALARWRGLCSAEGVPLRFVAGSDLGAMDYEQRILRHGEISCKLHGTGARHDFHNGLVWLRFPRFKAACNILHCRNKEGGDPRSGRGHQRDALTLIDENGAIWPAPRAEWVDALRQRHWVPLFVGQRAALMASTAPVIVGHGLLEKLHQPYKSMTAKLLVCSSSPVGLDRALAAQIMGMAASDSLKPAACMPLPLSAWPGWDAGNADPGFYADDKVFRALPVH